MMITTLHVQCWVPNFFPNEANITSLLVWVRFSLLPVECFATSWLERAGNRIGKTLKVVKTTQLTSQGNLARVCVEVDLAKPLKARYKFRGRTLKLQYEGLYNLCFQCGKYGHRIPKCSRASMNDISSNDSTASHERVEGRTPDPQNQEVAKESKYYGQWMLGKRHRRRLVKISWENGSIHQEGSRFDPLANLNENNLESESRLALPLA